MSFSAIGIALGMTDKTVAKAIRQGSGTALNRLGAPVGGEIRVRGEDINRPNRSRRVHAQWWAATYPPIAPNACAMKAIAESRSASVLIRSRRSNVHV